jgi:ribose 5-phosphate isomerase B
MDKTVFIATDHAGFSAKNSVKERLKALGFEVQDLGPASEERVDYPDFADRVCHKLKTHPEAFGLLICGSGQGMAMRANKYTFIRPLFAGIPSPPF